MVNITFCFFIYQKFTYTFKNNFSYDNNIIKDSIAGNLCRCTGYAPIVKAAKSLNGKNKNDNFLKTKKITINLLKKINKSNNLIIDNKNNKYYSPNNVRELKKLLKKYPNSNILNGGTDLSLEVTKKRKEFESIIYIGSIKELDYIKKNYKYI